MAQLKTSSTAGGSLILTDSNLFDYNSNSTGIIDFSTGYNFEIVDLTSDITIQGTNAHLGQRGLIKINNLAHFTITFASIFELESAAQNTVSNGGVTILKYEIVDTNIILLRMIEVNSYWDTGVDSFSYSTTNSFAFNHPGVNSAGTIFFKPDGTKLYVGDYATDAIYQYTLSEPWEVTSCSYDSVSFSNATQDGSVYDLKFKSDGTKMYLLGNATDTVYQYSLSTAWDLSTASYDSVSFSVTTQEDNPYGLYFKDDGTKMYMIGFTNDTVYQYTLSTAWDLSTASYDSVSYSAATQIVSGMSLAFSTDGTKMHIVNNSDSTVYQYTLSTPWVVSSASYDSVSFSFATQNTNPTEMYFKSDGLMLYLVSTLGDIVYQYRLYTARNVSTMRYDLYNFSVTDQDTTPTGIEIKPDGTKMYVLGAAGDAVYQYSMSEPYDIRTTSYDVGFFSVNAQSTSPVAFRFKQDGTKMYVLDASSGTIFQYTLSTPWAVSSASYDSVSYLITAQDTAPYDIFFKPDGSKLYLLGRTNDTVYQYTLSTPWVISTATYDSVSFSITAQEPVPTSLSFSPNGAKMYVDGGTNNTVYQYTLSTPWAVSSASYDGVSKSYAAQESTETGVIFNYNKSKMYVVGLTADTIHQYNI